MIQLDVLQPESCEGCGLCCEGIGSPVLNYQTGADKTGLQDGRPPGLPGQLIREIDEHFRGLIRGQEPQEQCLWFDAEMRNCKHHEWRPQVCRDYQLGGPSCLEERRQLEFRL